MQQQVVKSYWKRIQHPTTCNVDTRLVDRNLLLKVFLSCHYHTVITWRIVYKDWRCPVLTLTTNIWGLGSWAIGRDVITLSVRPYAFLNPSKPSLVPNYYVGAIRVILVSCPRTKIKIDGSSTTCTHNLHVESRPC